MGGVLEVRTCVPKSQHSGPDLLMNHLWLKADTAPPHCRAGQRGEKQQVSPRKVKERGELGQGSQDGSFHTGTWEAHFIQRKEGLELKWRLRGL